MGIQTNEGTAEADAKVGGELSMDTLALMSTAVLGIATFVLQSQEERGGGTEGSRAGTRGSGAGTGARSGAAGAGAEPYWRGYRPVQTRLLQAGWCAMYIERELGFDCTEIWGFEFVRPLALWPHIEVTTRDFSAAPRPGQAPGLQRGAP
jgi:hypothetical protein